MNINKNGAIKEVWSLQKILKTMNSRLSKEATDKGSALKMFVKWTRKFQNIEKTKISSGNILSGNK